MEAIAPAQALAQPREAEPPAIPETPQLRSRTLDSFAFRLLEHKVSSPLRTKPRPLQRHNSDNVEVICINTASRADVSRGLLRMITILDVNALESETAFSFRNIDQTVFDIAKRECSDQRCSPRCSPWTTEPLSPRVC